MTRPLGVAVTHALILLLIITVGACSRDAATLTALQRARSGAMDVVVLSTHDALRHGKDEFVIEFRSSDGHLTDVGEVRVTASMPMSGMPMFGSIGIRRSDVPGRYLADADLSMAGTWRLNVAWDGPNGRGSVAFSGSVQ